MRRATRIGPRSVSGTPVRRRTVRQGDGSRREGATTTRPSAGLPCSEREVERLVEDRRGDTVEVVTFERAIAVHERHDPRSPRDKPAKHAAPKPRRGSTTTVAPSTRARSPDPSLDPLSTTIGSTREAGQRAHRGWPLPRRGQGESRPPISDAVRRWDEREADEPEAGSAPYELHVTRSRPVAPCLGEPSAPRRRQHVREPGGLSRFGSRSDPRCSGRPRRPPRRRARSCGSRFRRSMRRSTGARVGVAAPTLPSRSWPSPEHRRSRACQLARPAVASRP